MWGVMAMVQHNVETVNAHRFWRVSQWLEHLGALLVGRVPADMMRGGDLESAVTVQHTIFSYALAALACKLMRVDDGEIHPRERAACVAMFMHDGMAASRMKALMAAAARDAAPMQQYARQLLMFCAGSPQRKRDVLVRMVRVAMADGQVNEREYEFLCEFSSVLEFPVEEIAKVIDDAEGPVEGKPWDVLRISRTATQDEVQRAYRERMRACHPDRWKNAGAQAIMHRFATRRSIAVNAAYVAMGGRTRL